MDAFDADVLIYAAVRDHPLGRRVLALLSEPGRQRSGTGSVLLLPEILSKPLAEGNAAEVSALARLLARLDLQPVDRHTAELAAALSGRYGLRAADATHLATAINAGADRFITNNSRDFPQTISGVRVTYPADLADAPARTSPQRRPAK